MAISFKHLSYSLWSCSSSNPISLYNLIERIASACFSVNKRVLAASMDFFVLKVILSTTPLIKHCLASSSFFEPRSISIIKSIQSTALIRPSLISLLISSFSRRVVYFLLLISIWKSVKCLNISNNESVSGLPFTVASIFTPNVSSNLVFL